MAASLAREGNFGAGKGLGGDLGMKIRGVGTKRASVLLSAAAAERASWTGRVSLDGREGRVLVVIGPLPIL